MGNKSSNASTTLFDLTREQRCLSSLNDEKFDIDSVIWFDEKCNGNSIDTLRTKTLLQKINNNHCLFYEQMKDFQIYIEQVKCENKNFLLILSGSFAQRYLSQIHSSTSTIIIFCNNSAKHVHLQNIYTSIVDICTNHAALEQSLKRELLSLKLNLFKNQSFKTIRSVGSTSDDYTSRTAYFSYISFVDILRQMAQTTESKEIMLKKCEEHYRQNQRELQKIDLFRKTYAAVKALDWYTSDSFVYRLVNKAFRTEDITFWYVFRFYIIDLCKQIKSVHAEQQQEKERDYLLLYRGQAHMPGMELESIKANIGGLISTNGFLSTTKRIDIAKQFLAGATNTDEFKVIMFEITLDSAKLCNIRNNISFVDIDQYKGFQSESEVLFNMDTLFQIEQVYYNQECDVWIIKMNVTNERSEEIQQQLELTRKKFQTSGNINLLFGRLLLDMGHYTKAESYFQMMLDVLPKMHKDIPLVYNYMGDVNMRTTNWNEALKNLKCAHAIKKTNGCENDRDMGLIYNNIGNYYKAIGDFDMARTFYEQALKCKNAVNDKAIGKINIANVLFAQKLYDEALELCTEARDDLQQVHPLLYTEVIYCQGIIGDIYLAQEEYQTAEAFYLTAFEMSEKHLLIGDRLRTQTIKALIHLYAKQNDSDRVITLWHAQISLHKKYLSENHTSVAHLYIELATLHNDAEQQLSFYEKALNILVKNVHLDYALTANCLTNIGNHYTAIKKASEALSYYVRAQEINKRIYPKDHQVLIDTQRLIE